MATRMNVDEALARWSDISEDSEDSEDDIDSESDAESSENSDNDVAGGPSLAKSKWRVTDLKKPSILLL